MILHETVDQAVKYAKDKIKDRDEYIPYVIVYNDYDFMDGIGYVAMPDDAFAETCNIIATVN